MSVRSGYLHYFVPTSGHAMQQHKKRGSTAGKINEQLRYISPDHRFHPAFQCVEQRQGNDNYDGEMLSGTEHHAQYNRDRRDAHTLGQRPRDQKRAGRHRAHALTKTLFDKRISREEIPTKISWQKHEDDQHAPDQIAENKL